MKNMKIFTLLFLPAVSVLVIVLLCRVSYPASGHYTGLRTVLKHYLIFDSIYGLLLSCLAATVVLQSVMLVGSVGENMVMAVFIITSAGILNRMKIFRHVRQWTVNLLVVSASALSLTGVFLSFTELAESVSLWLRICYVTVFLSGLLLLADQQCRLIIRMEKERIGKDIIKSIWMVMELIMVQTVFVLFLVIGLHNERRCLSAICLAAFLQASHSVETAMDIYPSIWYENKIRQIMRKIEMNKTNETFEEQDGMVVRLTEYFETKKPFLSPDLCLSEVAVALMTNKTTLSRVIHHQMKMSFRELVNRFRVKEAISIYANNMLLDVAELARLSGFRNNASFTNAFKLNIGKTPGAWCKEYKEQRNEIWKKEILETCDAGNRNKKREERGYEPILPKSGIDESNNLS